MVASAQLVDWANTGGGETIAANQTATMKSSALMDPPILIHCQE
jgi:hypothetical protein